ncbi:hypothetical protein C8Q73DRAFT_660246 [Cubamyces lactineus]|nr:hypothetical protein C8Q73DRAFT_660246 [Cubamyces lactineus]
MNFTLDDSDPSLSFSTSDWAIQNSSDPYLDRFFDNTYHVAQRDGATISFQFQGSGFAIYGSTGPGHAKFSVQYDNVVANNLDASASQTRFRQQLFAHTFGSESQPHTVKLTAVLTGVGLAGEWLDVDYITLTSPANASTSSGLPTVTAVPPWLSGSSSTSTLLAFTPTGRPDSTYVSYSSSSSSKVPTILAALFGSLIGLAALLLVLYCVLRRIYERRRARERAFRYGQSSANPSVSLAGTYAPSSGGSAKGSGFGPGAILDMRSAPYSHSHAHAHSGSNGGSLASHAVEMRSFSTDVHRDPPDRDRDRLEREAREREGAGTPTTAQVLATRPLLSASPIAWTRQKVGGGHKGDADSLRTDFLQV